MKFKKNESTGVKEITISCKYEDEFYDEFYVATEDGGTGLFFSACDVVLSRKKAIKLAHAIIAELDPENMWVMS